MSEHINKPRNVDPLADMIAQYYAFGDLNAKNTELEARLARSRADNAQLESERDHWKNTAETDDLTGVHNRRKQPSRDGGYTIIYLDADKFKPYNAEPFNHDFGDEVIKGLAQILKGVLRDSDQVEIIREGGDEFLLRLYDCPESYAPMMADLVRMAVITYDWKEHFKDHEKRGILEEYMAEQDAPFMSISLGYAYVQNAIDEPQLKSLAESYMQKAKRVGGNAVGNVIDEVSVDEAPLE